MRAVILYNTSWYVYLLRRNLIKALQASGVEVTVVSPSDRYTERVKALGVSHVPISMNPRSVGPLTEAATVASIYRALRRARPDAVLSFTAKCNVYAGLLRGALGFRQVANVSGLGEGFQRSGALSAVMRRLYRLSLFSADRVLFQNQEDHDMCVGNGLTHPERSTVIPGSGVDLGAFFPAPKTMPSPLTFLMFGRLLPKKGFDSFLKAASRLKEEFGNACSFWVLGAADYDRPESLDLLERVMEAHSQGHVRYLQSTDDVLPILRDADAVVLPSTYNEGIPRSLLEALACGKIIVTTDWKGCRETVHHGRNGFLVAPQDDLSLTQHLRKVVELPELARIQMGNASRKLAQERFDERAVIDAYKRALGISRVTPLPSVRREPVGPSRPSSSSSVRAFHLPPTKRGEGREQRL